MKSRQKKRNILQPEFFDIFGIATFTFILFVGFYSLFTTPPKMMSLILILVAIAGLVVDVTIVLNIVKL